MADRRIGCLLSGGLDSSLIASLLVQEAKKVDLPYKIQARILISIFFFVECMSVFIENRKFQKCPVLLKISKFSVFFGGNGR